MATTMGFTALDGLPMGTRCGELDPGVVLHLIQQKGMTAEAVTDLLYRRSGMLGLSGVSSDFRDLLASEEPRARFAVDAFCYWTARQIASLAAALGGLDGHRLHRRRRRERRADPGRDLPRLRAGSASSWTRRPTRRTGPALPHPVEPRRRLCHPDRREFDDRPARKCAAASSAGVAHASCGIAHGTGQGLAFQISAAYSATV